MFDELIWFGDTFGETLQRAVWHSPDEGWGVGCFCFVAAVFLWGGKPRAPGLDHGHNAEQSASWSEDGPRRFTDGQERVPHSFMTGYLNQ